MNNRSIYKCSQRRETKTYHLRHVKTQYFETVPELKLKMPVYVSTRGYSNENSAQHDALAMSSPRCKLRINSIMLFPRALSSSFSMIIWNSFTILPCSWGSSVTTKFLNGDNKYSALSSPITPEWKKKKTIEYRTKSTKRFKIYWPSKPTTPLAMLILFFAFVSRWLLVHATSFGIKIRIVSYRPIPNEKPTIWLIVFDRTYWEWSED